MERSLDLLWRARQKRTAGGRLHMLPKKKLAALPLPAAYISAIREAQKRGPHLLDSLEAASSLLPGADLDSLPPPSLPPLALRAASLLHADRSRFKRLPCAPLPAPPEAPPGTLLLLTGGWAALDAAQRATLSASLLLPSPSSPPPRKLPAEVARGLEGLAMGGGGGGLAVRELLKKMSLPLSPAGAEEALVRLNHWSSSDSGRARFSPWPSATLAAAKRFSSSNSARRRKLPPPSTTPPPAFAIDTPTTSFRDDAVSVLPLANGACEILVHVADASAVFGPGAGEDAGLLREAAKERGASRYDLAFGPLHMLPPPVLSSLSLQPDCPSEVVTVGARIDASSGELLGARIFRSVLPRTTTLSYPAADDVLQNAHPREPLPLIADLLDKWHRRRIKASEATKKRYDRLDRKASEGFERTPAHRLVDHSLELYGYVVTKLLRKKEVAVPRLPGAGVKKGGRTATGVLRRPIDCIAQQQALAALCGVGELLSDDDVARDNLAAGLVANANKNR
ncbi:hypothetical protein TeGR_g9913 [Tetraparma gracilis]|uniref:RNB domain-containing protein n=1 Tax=Tetraparma gracilis TaxID=2962635 RepID=A0ABQ6MVV9_9STRA|nr:hypothetical protein TeGR_g9913 [Tetraparma gracilis]